jgi:catechol 2,3-dioxygenase
MNEMPDRIDSAAGIGLVKLRVSDLKRSIRFYEDIVGLKLMAESAGTADLTADGTTPLVRLQEIAGAVVPPRRSQAGLYHFAILVPDRRALGLSLRNLVASGIHIGQADHLVSEALYIADPDNNGIEIYRDRPRKEWNYEPSGHVKMASDPLDWQGLLAEAGDAPWDGLPPGTIMGHIHLHVSDLAATRRFYDTILGFNIMAEWGGAALFVAAGGYHHHVGLNTWAGAGAPLAPDNAAGLAYYELHFPDPAGIQAVISRLEEAGIPVSEESGSAVLHDPTGIQIRLVLK